MLFHLSLEDDLEKRKRLRQKKARDEKRREKRIEMEENRKQGKCEHSDEYWIFLDIWIFSLI